MSFLFVDTLAGFVVVVFVEFKPDKVPLLLNARHGGRAATHEMVKDCLTFLAAVHNKRLNDIKRLYGRVSPLVFVFNVRGCHPISFLAIEVPIQLHSFLTKEQAKLCVG